jgi:hypothetical protein
MASNVPRFFINLPSLGYQVIQTIQNSCFKYEHIKIPINIRTMRALHRRTLDYNAKKGAGEQAQSKEQRK